MNKKYRVYKNSKQCFLKLNMVGCKEVSNIFVVSIDCLLFGRNFLMKLLTVAIEFFRKYSTNLAKILTKVHFNYFSHIFLER